MEKERRKIYQLSYEEVRKLLAVNYIKVGIQIAINDPKFEIIIPDVYRYFGSLWSDVLDNIFSEFAGRSQKNADKIPITVSSYFIKKIRELYFENLNSAKEEEKPKRKKLSDKEYAYYNLIGFCLEYDRFPENINWQLVLSYLVEKNHFKLYEGFEKEEYAIKEKTARVHVKAWVKENMPQIKANIKKQKIAA